MQSSYITRLEKSLVNAQQNAEKFKNDYLEARYKATDPDELEDMKRLWIQWGGVVVGIETAMSIAELEGI